VKTNGDCRKYTVEAGVPATYGIVAAGSVNNPVIGDHTAVGTSNTMLQLVMLPTSPPNWSTMYRFHVPLKLPVNVESVGFTFVILPGPGAGNTSGPAIFVGL
jgi:hypothetical protein